MIVPLTDEIVEPLCRYTPLLSALPLPPWPFNEIAPSVVVRSASSSSIPTKSPKVVPAVLAFSVIPPLTVVRLEPELSRMFRVAVRPMVPETLLAISDPALGALIVLASTVRDLPAANVIAPLRLTVSPPLPPLMSMLAG